jgi:hypothetical protein
MAARTLAMPIAHARFRWFLRSIALVFAALAPAAPVGAQIAFVDVSRTAGVDRAGESYGASWGDLDGDGYPDLFASNHREQPSLFLNRRNGRFHETGPQVLTWRNRSRADTHGGSWSDFDNDGDQDLLVSAGTGNLSQLLVNEYGRLVDRTRERGLTTVNLGGRLPVWLDYDGDQLTDFVMTQYGGIAKLYRQVSPGMFSETTGDAKLLCKRFHYGHLVDVNNDGRLDFLCADERSFPQRIYDTEPFPWRKLYDSASPARYLPAVRTTSDSIVADFDNDGRMDFFVLGGTQLRPSSVVQAGDSRFEAQLTGGIKGFRFVTTGKVSLNFDWNKQDERKITDYTKIQIGSGARSPTANPIALDPADPSVRGMPPAPTQQWQLPVMQIGYDAARHEWTVVIRTKLPGSKSVFSEAYLQVASNAPVTRLVGTGLWGTDKPARPTLLMNRSGGYLDETARAGLDAPIQCASAVAGDFDNDMDVDLYLACRTGASNLANRLYENVGGGVFRLVAGAGGATGPVGAAVASGAGTADTVVVADYDVDGFLDLFVANGFNLRPLLFGGANNLFRNRGNANRWVQVDLVGTRSDRDAVGARVYATANGVTQLRVQDGSYHRWSQDMRRAHFGLKGATTVDLRVEWPSGSVQTFSRVASNRLYRISEGAGISPVALGQAPAYSCGAPPLSGAKDSGVFLWRDCPSGEWRLKTVAAGGSAEYAGVIKSDRSYTRVKGVALNAADVLAQPDPRTIRFRFDTRGTGTDGLNFVPQDGARTCLDIDVPAGTRVHYGPFRELVTPPFDVDSQMPCQG